MRDYELMDVASLHPKTVQNYQEFIRRVYRPGTNAQFKVRVVQVDQRVWQEAMRLARGDRSRIVVHSATEVIVVNQSKRKA